MTTQIPSHVSLFEMTLRATERDVPIIQCSKKTLVHLSHALEDVILKHRIPALMFTGFQESSHWAKETKRYREIAAVAHQICIFAGKPLPDDQPASVLQIELSRDDPLRQEWFVIIISQRFSVLLTGKDRQSPEDVEDVWRTFDTILSFDPAVLHKVLEALHSVLAKYRPDLLEELQATRQRFAPLQNDLTLVSRVVRDMMHFEEALNQTLRSERDFNKRLIDTMPAYALTLTAEGQVFSANPALYHLLNVPLETLVGQLFWPEYHNADDTIDLNAAMAPVLTSGRAQSVQATLYTPDDDLRTVEWQLTRIDAPQQPPLIFAMGHDVTDRLQAEILRREDAVLRAQLEKERELSQLRRQFITTVSHEFRTPLTTLLNNAEMIERANAGADETLARRVSKIIRQVQAINTMVDEISSLIHANSGDLTFAPKAYDIDLLTRRILDGLRTQNVYGEDRIQYQTTIIEPMFLADSRLLRFILSNLIGNALKYSPVDQPVMVKLHQEADQLIYEVQDFGAGIPAEDRGRLFEAFYRGSNVGQTRGTGLGLRIVRDCALIYGGTVTYRTGSDGTTFIVRLPIPESAASDETESETPSA